MESFHLLVGTLLKDPSEREQFFKVLCFQYCNLSRPMYVGLWWPTALILSSDRTSSPWIMARCSTRNLRSYSGSFWFDWTSCFLFPTCVRWGGLLFILNVWKCPQMKLDSNCKVFWKKLIMYYCLSPDGVMAQWGPCCSRGVCTFSHPTAAPQVTAAPSELSASAGSCR